MQRLLMPPLKAQWHPLSLASKVPQEIRACKGHSKDSGHTRMTWRCFSSIWSAMSFFMLSCPVPSSSTCLVRSMRRPRLLRLRKGHRVMPLLRHTLFRVVMPKPSFVAASCRSTWGLKRKSTVAVDAVLSYAKFGCLCGLFEY